MQKNKALILAHLDPPRKRLKRRAALAVAFFSLFGMVTAFGTVRETAQPSVERVMVIEKLAISAAQVPDENAHVFWQEERFDRGDTLAALLARLGVDPAVAARLVRENGRAKPFRALRPGMAVQALTADHGDLLSLRFVAGRDTVLGFDRTPDGFSPVEEPAEFSRAVQMKTGEIQSSLFAAADDAGLPDSVAIQLAEIFGGDIDFHRDLRKGDRFSVIYETLYHQGRAIKSGRVLAAEFINDGREYRAVWFGEDPDGGSYYAPDGQSLRKAFLRSPLEFSRVTSGFSTRRFHPLLKKWRAHRGVDYGAPTGTRVRATGDGVVQSAGRQNGYGNVVVLRHKGRISTLYAHLSKFGAGIRRGARVSQGDVIGYVGATGWATGPHLHYEFRVGDQHRNPLKMVFPSAEPVPVARMAAFRDQTGPYAAQLDQLRSVEIAALD
ncbi:MAG: peptidoglycan DD-metalloendopeptidase family protein [Betaproteobacteria bacterium]|jgi:murein DD-endopeptidase MepM/ murein hydrolase activator NlpD|nr:peptidoglycan DD-metalloendopeptidase family protein [Betaproteobacteria bacterium]